MCADVIIEINNLLYLFNFAVFFNKKNVKCIFKDLYPQTSYSLDFVFHKYYYFYIHIAFKKFVASNSNHSTITYYYSLFDKAYFITSSYPCKGLV